ncbi:hypothetical protein L484_009263 [Morus notabilis]|uniref:Uncharacterized protein n=1 Tax=Morus notabilis TaxID=981085 RepID=W9SEF6_9ROSA|nr:hypothetical protein L484_009263 [Morus notabilis]
MCLGYTWYRRNQDLKKVVMITYLDGQFLLYAPQMWLLFSKWCYLVIQNSNIHHFDGEFYLLYASIRLVDTLWLARNKLVRDAKGFDIADIHSSVQSQFNHISQLNHPGSCNSASRAIVRDSDMIRTIS